MLGVVVSKVVEGLGGYIRKIRIRVVNFNDNRVSKW